MYALPCFADLLLLPGVIEKGARATLDQDSITITCEHPKEMARVLNCYPHMTATVECDNTVSLRLSALQPKFVSMRCVSGEHHGVLIWGKTHYSSVPGNVIDDLVAAGHTIMPYKCREGQSFIEAVEACAAS